MARRITESLKWDIVNAYDNQNDTQAIAQMLGISRRSVQRVLNEKGVFGRKQASTTPAEPQEQAPRYSLPRRQSVEVTDDQLLMLEILRKYDQNAESLLRVLNSPAMTPDNVKLYLAGLSNEQMGSFFYASVLNKIVRDYQAKQDAQEEAAS